jgi:hypothetical protein
MKNNGCLISFILFVFILFLGIYIALSPTNNKIVIDQKIGGKLICNSTFYWSPHHSEYVVQYIYQLNENKLDTIGTGLYHSADWSQKDQLQKSLNWVYLKTKEFNDDKIIIADSSKLIWKEFVFSPNNIENELIWKKEKIKANGNYLNVATINKIENDIIEVNYEYMIDSINFELKKAKILLFEIDKNSVVPKLKGFKNHHLTNTPINH